MKEQKNQFTDIVVILDRSGSMEFIWKESISGLNEFINEQKKLGDSASFSLVAFDTKVSWPIEMKAIRKIQKITGEDFEPRGLTALYDAIGKTITYLDRQSDEDDTKKLIVILTDGEENASNEYDQSDIKRLISSHKESGNWEFLFLAANQDAILTASEFGIESNKAINFEPNARGIDLTYQTMNMATKSYRTTGSVGDTLASNYVEDIESK